MGSDQPDLAGNAMRVTQTLTIEEGGKPRADIAQGEVDWEALVDQIFSHDKIIGWW